MSMQSRGPDGWGVKSHGKVSLGHRRLAIVDPGAQSDQPMESESWILSYNGEIVNYRPIRKELEAEGVAFATNSDTEVLLKGLDVWGLDKILSKAAGMFAFLAFHKSTGDLYAVRDHMGIKPLFYAESPGKAISFASSVAALANEFDGEVQPNKAAIGTYLVLGGAFLEETCINGIRRVPPATYMRVSPEGGIHFRRFWVPEYSPGFTMEDLVEVALEYQESDVQAALFLSGGVDSTFLASLYRNLDAFHLTSPEEDHARRVAKKYGFTMKVVDPSLEDFEGDVAGIIRSHGEPLMSCGIPGAVSRAVSRSGYKMAVSANGADELFLGYSRTPLTRKLSNSFPLGEKGVRATFGSQLRHVFRDTENFELAEEFDVPTIMELGSDALKEFKLEGFPESASYRWFELMTYVLYDLNPTLDAASMFHSLEIRVPFLDHRIVQGVLSWDESELVQGIYGRKAPLKRWLEKDFPISFLNRPKVGFSVDEDKLGEISSMYRRALKRAESEGRIRWKKERQGSFYGRDQAYISMCFHGLHIWEGQMSNKTKEQQLEPA